MSTWIMRAVLAVASLAVAVTAPAHWMGVLFAFLAGVFCAAAMYVTIIERAADHEPY